MPSLDFEEFCLMMSSKVLCLSYNSDSILHIKKITLAWLWCQTKQMRWPNNISIGLNCWKLNSKNVSNFFDSTKIIVGGPIFFLRKGKLPFVVCHPPLFLWMIFWTKNIVGGKCSCCCADSEGTYSSLKISNFQIISPNLWIVLKNTVKIKNNDC